MPAASFFILNVDHRDSISRPCFHAGGRNRGWIKIECILYLLTAYPNCKGIEMRTIALVLALNFLSVTMAFANDATVKDIVVYKNPECGCCTKWVKYLQDKNYNVTVEETRDIWALKERLGVPQKLAACHTAVIDGYIVEGHITHRDIKRLLLFRPDIKGIAVPGMPIGTPGMERGDTVESYNVLSFDEHGKTEVFSAH